MIHELRIYDAVPGKMAALAKHLEVACGLFPQHGFEVLGAWTDEIGRGGRISYMLGAKDEAARNAGLAAFAASDAWKRFADEEKRKEGAVVARVHNTLLRPTAYWPAPKLVGRIQELRTYEAAPGRLADLNARFAGHTVGFFRKYGIGIVGFWTEIYGTSSKLVYMTAFESLADREKRWPEFLVDADWRKVLADSDKDGPLTVSHENRLLKPTAFSPRA